MLQNFFMKQMLQNQLKSLPPEQREKAMAAFESNPDFFKNIVGEIAERLKRGESQQAAIMAVLSTHRAELEKMFKP